MNNYLKKKKKWKSETWSFLNYQRWWSLLNQCDITKDYPGLLLEIKKHICTLAELLLPTLFYFTTYDGPCRKKSCNYLKYVCLSLVSFERLNRKYGRHSDEIFSCVFVCYAGKKSFCHKQNNHIFSNLQQLHPGPHWYFSLFLLFL